MTESFVTRYHKALHAIRREAMAILKANPDMTTAEYHIDVNQRTGEVDFGEWCLWGGADGFLEEYAIASDVKLTPRQLAGHWIGIVHEDGAYLMPLADVGLDEPDIEAECIS